MPVFNVRKQGIYRAKYVGCKDVEFTDQDTGEVQPRWRWTFQEVNDATTVGEISKITSRSLSAASNGGKIAAGIVGRKLQPDDDTEQYVGNLYDVVWGPNQADNLTITNVIPVREAASAAPAPASVPAESPATPPELP